MWSHRAAAQYSMLNSGVLILTEFSAEKLGAAEEMEGCSWEMISWISWAWSTAGWGAGRRTTGAGAGWTRAGTTAVSSTPARGPVQAPGMFLITTKPFSTFLSSLYPSGPAV